MDDRELRLRQLKVRSWRRGTREMDLILGGFCDARAASLPAAGLAALEALLGEDDGALTDWIAAGDPAPERHAAIVAEIRAFLGLG